MCVCVCKTIGFIHSILMRTAFQFMCPVATPKCMYVIHMYIYISTLYYKRPLFFRTFIRFYFRSFSRSHYDSVCIHTHTRTRARAQTLFPSTLFYFIIIHSICSYDDSFIRSLIPAVEYHNNIYRDMYVRCVYMNFPIFHAKRLARQQTNQKL